MGDLLNRPGVQYHNLDGSKRYFVGEWPPVSSNVMLQDSGVSRNFEAQLVIAAGLEKPLGICVKQEEIDGYVEKAKKLGRNVETTKWKRELQQFFLNVPAPKALSDAKDCVMQIIYNQQLNPNELNILDGEAFIVVVVNERCRKGKSSDQDSSTTFHFDAEGNVVPQEKKRHATWKPACDWKPISIEEVQKFLLEFLKEHPIEKLAEEAPALIDIEINDKRNNDWGVFETDPALNDDKVALWRLNPVLVEAKSTAKINGEASRDIERA